MAHRAATTHEDIQGHEAHANTVAIKPCNHQCCSRSLRQAWQIACAALCAAITPAGVSWTASASSLMSERALAPANYNTHAVSLETFQAVAQVVHSSPRVKLVGLCSSMNSNLHVLLKSSSHWPASMQRCTMDGPSTADEHLVAVAAFSDAIQREGCRLAAAAYVQERTSCDATTMRMPDGRTGPGLGHWPR